VTLPASVAALLASAAAVGFSGSRAPTRASVAAARAAVAVAARPILVGDQRGIDTVVQSACAGAQVFHAASRQPGHLAARSIAVVRTCAVLGGAWAAFPATACPAGLRPSSSSSACFSGLGSGTWSSLAFAIGLGVVVAIFLPPVAAGLAPVLPPASWGLVAAGAGWWVAQPQAQQLELF